MNYGSAAVILLVTWTQTLVTMSAVVPSALAPALAGALGVRTELIGFQIAMVYGAAMASSTVGGAVVRRWGACRISQCALLLCAIGSLSAAVPSVAALAAGSVLIGLGYGLTNPSSSHLLEKLVTPANRNLVYSVKQAGVPLGGILAGVVAPPVAVLLGWPWSFALTSAVLIALVVGLQPLRATWDGDRDPTVPVLRSPITDLLLVWRSPVLRWLSLSAFFFAAIQLCLTTFAVALLVEDLGFGLIAAGTGLSALQAAGFFGRIAWGWVADRLGGFIVLMVMACVSTAGVLATPLLSADTSRVAIYLLLFAVGSAAIGWNGVYLAEVAGHSPRERIGSATGASLVFTFAGVLTGPPAFALLHEPMGTYTATFGAFAALPVAGLALVVLARRASGRRVNPAAARSVR